MDCQFRLIRGVSPHEQECFLSHGRTPAATLPSLAGSTGSYPLGILALLSIRGVPERKSHAQREYREPAQARAPLRLSSPTANPREKEQPYT